MMKIGITNDHAATKLKFDIMDYLTKQGYEVINYGTNDDNSCDYPVEAAKLCRGFKEDGIEKGIAICGTGVGISIACNKHKGIRACVCSEPETAKLSREHNDANVICFGARIIDLDMAKKIVDTFLNTEFSNGERHIRRIQEIKDLDEGKDILK